jgi:hypothetical protein
MNKRMNNTFVQFLFHIFHPGLLLHGAGGEGIAGSRSSLTGCLPAPSLLLCFLFFHKRCAQFVFSTSRFLVREEDTGFALSLIPICWNLTKICGGGGGGGFLFPGAEERGRGWGRESQSVGGLRELRCVRTYVRPSVRPCGAVGNLLPWCTNRVYYDAAATATHQGRSP